MDFVINEWFPEYCRVEAPNEDRELLKIFLERFVQKSDVLYIRKPSPFLKKIYTYANEYQGHSDVSTVRRLRYFIKEVFSNSDKCVQVTEDCFLDDVVIERLNWSNTNYASDTYLFEAAAKTESKTIITTDTKLRDHMNTVGGFRVIHLRDFLRDY